MQLSDSANTAIVAIIIIICIFGVLGNLLVIFVVLVLREYKKVTHWYILQLAIADLLFLLTLPLKISEKINREWIYSNAACKTKETILFLNYYASILFLTMMSIDRYIAVCHSFSNFASKWRSRRAAIIISAAIWIASLILCTPVIMFSQKTGVGKCSCSYTFPKSPETWCRENGFPDGEDYLGCLGWAPSILDLSCKKSIAIPQGQNYDYSGDAETTTVADSINVTTVETTTTTQDTSNYIHPSCHYWDQGPRWTGFLLFNFIGMFILPFLIITTCYSLIVFKLSSAMGGPRNKSDNENRAYNGDRSSSAAATNRSDVERRRVTIMCAVLVTLFAVCWLPFHSVHLAKMVGISAPYESNLCIVLPEVVSVLAYLNSCLDPYFYNFMGSFAKRFRQIAQQEAVQSFLSATGITRIGGGRTTSASESSRGKLDKSKSDNYSTTAQGRSTNEAIALNPMK